MKAGIFLYKGLNGLIIHGFVKKFKLIPKKLCDIQRKLVHQKINFNNK